MKFKIRLMTILCMCVAVIGCTKENSPIVKTEDVKVTTAAATKNEADTTTAEVEDMATAATTTAKKTPAIVFESITLDGEKVTSDCFANSKLTMINVWGTYCSPCLGEMPDLGEISDEFDDSVFQIIGVVCDVEDDASQEYIDGVKKLVQETGANYTHLLLSDSLLNSLVSSVYYVPTSFFFNQDGEYLGYVESAYPKKTWVNVIESLLADMK